MKPVYHADKIYEDDLKPCPLCGSSVKMYAEGKAFMTGPAAYVPVFNVHLVVKCPQCFLKLDLANKGFIDLGVDEEENEKVLQGVLGWQAEKVRKVWNRRVNND